MVNESFCVQPRLTLETAPLADGCDAVCLFVNDEADGPVSATGIHRMSLPTSKLLVMPGCKAFRCMGHPISIIPYTISISAYQCIILPFF